MVPNFFGGRCDVDMARIDVAAIARARGAKICYGHAERIDHSARVVTLRDGTEHSYDVLSCNVGSQVLLSSDSGIRIEEGAIGKAIFPAKPVEHLIAARAVLLSMLAKRRRLSCAVIGSGAAACEIAGNLLHVASREAAARHSAMQVDLYCDPILLPRQPARFRRQAGALLRARGARFVDQARVASITEDTITLQNGERFPFDLCFVAVGVRAPRFLRASGLAVDSFGALRVNRYLQSESSAHIFGGGDCIAFTPQPLDKVGVYAVRQNRILAHNLGVALDRAEQSGALSKNDPASQSRPAFAPFRPQKHYFFALNLGGGYGVGTKWGIALHPKVAFYYKERFDRAFVVRYRSKEEPSAVVR